MDCKTRNGAPAALRVSSMPALSIQQPYCAVLMMMIVIIDTTEQASTRSIISALSPMHTRYIHATRCMLYTPPIPPTTHAYIQPFHQHPSHTSPIFPQAAAACPATQPARAILSTPIMRHPPHVRVHVSTHHAETHKHTSTDDEARLPPPQKGQAFSFASSCGAGYAEK